MFGGYWLFLAALLFIAGLLLHQAPLLLVSLLFFLAGGAARLWSRYCLTRVEYQRRLSASHVFFGEEVQLEVVVVNRKPMPLPWVQINDEIPEEVTLLKGKTDLSFKETRLVLSNHLSLWWYHKIKRRYPISCLQRGYFIFGPARVQSGDLFGFFKREMEIPQVNYLVVYPKILPTEKLGIPSKQPLGDIRTRHIFEDPILTLGVRDYHFGDSLKRVHWKTTARTGKLQTKVFEPTTTLDVGIFLDVRTTVPPLWGFIPELLELSVIAAASIANYAVAQGYRVGLYANQSRRFSAELIKIAPSQHPDQLLHILEALAQVQPVETVTIEKLLQQENSGLPWGSTVLVITAAPMDALLSTLVKMRRAGRMVVLVLVGGTEPSVSTDGLTVYHIRDDVMWRDLEQVSLVRR